MCNDRSHGNACDKLNKKCTWYPNTPNKNSDSGNDIGRSNNGGNANSSIIKVNGSIDTDRDYNWSGAISCRHSGGGDDGCNNQEL